MEIARGAQNGEGETESRVFHTQGKEVEGKAEEKTI